MNKITWTVKHECDMPDIEPGYDAEIRWQCPLCRYSYSKKGYDNWCEDYLSTGRNFRRINVDLPIDAPRPTWEEAYAICINKYKVTTYKSDSPRSWKFWRKAGERNE